MARYKDIIYRLQYLNGTVLTFDDEVGVRDEFRLRGKYIKQLKIGKWPSKEVDKTTFNEEQLELWHKWYSFKCGSDMHPSKILGLAIRKVLMGRPAPRLGFKVSKNEIRFKRELMELRRAHAGLAAENDRLRAENKQAAKLLAEAVQIHVKAWMLERKSEEVATEQPIFATLWYPKPGDMPNVADILGTLHYFGTSGKDAVRDVWDRVQRGRDPDVHMLHVAELVGDKLTLWWQGNYDVLRYRISNFTR